MLNNCQYTELYLKQLFVTVTKLYEDIKLYT